MQTIHLISYNSCRDFVNIKFTLLCVLFIVCPNIYVCIIGTLVISIVMIVGISIIEVAWKK